MSNKAGIKVVEAVVTTPTLIKKAIAPLLVFTIILGDTLS